MTDKLSEKIESVKKQGKIPEHVAIIMDGNGRWAKAKGLPRVAGHKRGVETVRDIVKASSQLGIKYLTLYTFSTENWKRPKDEVSTLMRLIVKSLQNETNELHKNNIKLSTIGDSNSLPTKVQQELEKAFDKTKDNTGLVLNLALNYSGRWEIINAFKSISKKIESKEISVTEISEELISKNLTTANIPDPDLLIRSGGEFRVSNFLLWQIAYSEIFIADVLWPNFKEDHLIAAINDFQNRERRFGQTSEQLN